ncbi:MAG: uroporphyrinogen decarboxylase family protein [bacterium]
MDLASTDMTQIEGGPRRLAHGLGLMLSPSASDAEADEAVLRALDTDIRGVGGLLFPVSPLARRISPEEVVNCWGITSRWNGHHYEMVEHPLVGKSIDDLTRFPWPDPEALSGDAMAGLAQRAQFLNEETPYVVCGRHPYYGVMELGCWMCGFDDFLYRMAAEPEFVHRFFGIIAGYQKRVDEVYYGAIGRHIHFTTSGDDFGTQIAPFISPAMFHDLVRPYLEERIRHIRLFTDAAFFHHSCGAIAPLIPDLIDAGVTILNPIQPRAAGMEPERLKKDFGSRLTFYGGVDTQELLPNGTPEQVAAETRKLIRVMGSDGGYILSAAHTFQEDVPVANIIAMYRAGKNFDVECDKDGLKLEKT